MWNLREWLDAFARAGQRLPWTGFRFTKPKKTWGLRKLRPEARPSLRILLLSVFSAADDPVYCVDEDVEFFIGDGLRVAQLVDLGHYLFVILAMGLAVFLDRVQTGSGDDNQAAYSFVLFFAIHYQFFDGSLNPVESFFGGHMLPCLYFRRS